MRAIPYVPLDIDEPRELVAAIRARRGGTLLNLDRMLLHSPPLAAGWNTLLRAVRTELAVPPKLRELAMCAVAVLNHAEYEFHHHAPLFLGAGGTTSQLDALRSVCDTGTESPAFDKAERTVLMLAIEMTRTVQLGPTTLAAARDALADDGQLVEIVGVIAAYNMVSRVIVALEIEPE
ncbi:MAG: carboxymuconolactone decarboxylase family protein [Betaproteobacteria bacterium]